MKKLALIASLLLIASLVSCGSVSTATETNAEEKYTPSAEITEYRGGADGCLTVVFDDGKHHNAEWMKENYPAVPVAYAIIVNNMARLKVTKSKTFKYVDENGKTKSNSEYVIDENGKFVYTLKTAEVEFWQGILANTNSELISHTFTHMYTGTSDEGGIVETRDEVLPARCITSDVIAAGQVLREVFGGHNGLVFADAGVGISRSHDTHSVYYDAVESYYIATRGGNSDIVSYDNFAEMKHELPGKMPETATEAKDGMTLEETQSAQLSSWLAYIDSAVENHAMAGLCIHNVGEDYIVTSIEHMKAMLNHALALEAEGKLWIAKITEATMYMEERLATTVTVRETDGGIGVKMTNSLDAIYDVSLTVKIAVPSDWTEAKLPDGSKITVENGFIMTDIYPNTDEMIITKGN